ncbi:alpha/beta hydrolase [Streptomyces cyanogenus]|uniref:Fermentation/respiration switch protein n=1 Tax=Streptomyces cyanogenus TaxID=80860 RepID=A0ABX7TM82_STRCY|nr:alpha/beta hydrolase [Streptomyces cyanogenus]QTD96708.1 fermentation/respiration switch protein [Streptomyces cyanogenus]
MNELAELKQHVAVHARGQRIADYRDILNRIRTDDGGGPGSWVGEWSRAAAVLEEHGKDLAAVKYYAMARFPYVDGPDRQEALERCVRAMDRWRGTQRSGIEPLDVQLQEGTVRCWAGGLSTSDPKPLLVVMGGIVSVKEQWAPMLAHVRRLGMAAVVAELPGTGENGLRYGAGSWRMLSGLLDAVADRADVSRTYATALSFSGHLALRCAVEDPRIRGVVTVGAPIGAFFTDHAWQKRLPRITVDTLAHMTGTVADAVPGALDEWALTREQLAGLDIPVAYVASRRDEIIPAADPELLRSGARRLDLVEFDDVHGAPHHVGEVQLWTTAALLHARGIRNAQSAVLGMLLRGQGLRRRLTGSRA